MKWIHSQQMPLPQFAASVLTVGNFDGVHLGHQSLLKELVACAQSLKAPSVVCTFRPHPKKILQPQTPVHRLFDYRDQAEMMEKLNIDYLIEEKFSKDFSLMSAEQFIENYLEPIYKPVHLVIGYDFNFGRSRTGNAELLLEYASKKKIKLTVVPPFEIDGQIVSSTVIRKFLEHGDLEKVKKFLGRSYYLRGPVRLGYQRGRTLGVPTANISPEIEFVPRLGVYFTKTILQDKTYPSITNIGYNPTFETQDPYLKVETHIFDFNQDIYGQQMQVELVYFHRDEMKFSSVEALKKQIEKDQQQARDYFNQMKVFI